MAGVQVVTPTDTANGVSLAFTTTPDRVAALQQQVELMAQRHNLRASQNQGGPVPPGSQGLGAVPPSTATATPLPNGARLDFAASSPTDIDALRRHVRARWQSAQSAQPPMP
jgi:hypothetical protein